MELFLFILFSSSFFVLRWWLHRPSLSFAAIASDVLASAQLAILCCFSSYVCFVVLGLAVPYSLFDGLIYVSLGLRMRFSLFHYVKQWKSFWESAKDLGAHRFLAFFLAWLVISGVLASHFSSPWPNGILGMGLLISMLCLGFFCRIPFHRRHQILHPLILEQIEMIKMRVYREKEQIGNWLPIQETNFRPFPDYPLFRYTTQFRGDKHFSFTTTTRQKPHIVFVFMESFRAKSVTACSATASIDLTPCFNRLAKEGVLWKEFYCVSTRSYKALIASLFGVSCKKDERIFRKIPSFTLRGLPEILKEKGYFNVLLQGGDLEFDRIREFAEAHSFDLIEGMQEIAARAQHEFQGSFWGINDEFVMKRAIEVLKQKDQEAVPSLMSLFTISNHHPWRLESGSFEEKSFRPANNSNEERFRKTLQYSDRCLGKFVEELEKEGLLEKTLLFILGDHGQAFSEHDEKSFDRDGLFEEHIKVPLLLLAKGSGILAQQIDEVASQQDLLPTVMDLLDIRTFHHSLGRSLCREQDGSIAMFHSPFFPYRFGLRKGQWKWIYNPETIEEELYDLEEDPLETENLIEKQPAILKMLREEGFARKEFLEALFEKKQLVPFQGEQEDHYIDLSGQRELTNQQLVEIVKKMLPVMLKIDDCEALSDEALYAIIPFCKRLKILSLRNCSRISLKALSAFCRSAPLLNDLNISHCFQIGKEGLDALFDRPSSLQRLCLEGLLFLDGDTIVSLLRKTPKLRRLSLLETPPIEDENIDAILNVCPELQFLRLDAGKVTNKGLETIAKKAHHLIGIYLVNGKQITDEGLATLEQRINLSSVVLIDCPYVQGHFLKSWRKLFLYSLYLNNVPLLEDEILEELLRHPLKHIQIHGCPKIQDKGIKSLSELGARSIHVVDCAGVTKEAIEFLRTKTEMVFWG